ncbi:MAG TPA: glycosyltransferase family 2 protein [Candidatus Eisenbacteria bacterium]|jgi:hypothetical protein|nr:glycosyltransferase family 2 protein [Candidatus Eisenbacteria bacterium]
MTFRFSGRGLTGRDRTLQRALEILPGLTSWSILLGMVWLSFRHPLAAAVAVIAFDLHWLFRIFYTTVFIVLATIRLSIEKNTDWVARVRGIDRLDAYRPELPPAAGWKEKFSLGAHRRQIESLRRAGASAAPPPSKEIYHLVIFPVAKETREIFEPGLRSIVYQRYPLKNILVVIALEERAPEDVKRQVHEARKSFDGFFDFLVVTHPDGIAGEARVKGANATYAAREAARLFEKKGIPFENVIASCFDADTVVSPDYFGCLTYHFLAEPGRTRASFQPIPVYHNNFWDAPGYARVLEMGSSFFQLMEATNPEKLVTFSSHSMSFKALVDCGYWPVDMISDDSAIFWKAYLHFDGRYRVVPMYVTLSMDVAVSDNWWKTVKNVYKQKRRWAWGVENFPIVMRGFLVNRRIPAYMKFKHAVKLFEGHVAWATWAFLLAVIGWLPGLFAGAEFSNSVLFYSAPRVTGTIFNLALLSLVTTMALSLYLLPDRKMRHPLWSRILFAVEWTFVPFIATFLSAMPALDTQTRFLLGRYMEFWVTEKKR